MIDNRYFRYLNLPFEFKPVEPDFGKSKHVTYNIGLNPEFVTWLASMGLEPGFAEVFKKSPGDNKYPWELHVDGVEFDDHVKINFVYGQGSSRMIWAKIKPGFEHNRKTTVVGTDYLWAHLENCEIVAEDQILKPALVNAGQLHAVIDVTEVRHAYSFMLRYKNSKKRLLWDDAMEIFKNYV